MTKEIRRLVAEMCAGMFLYALMLGILAVIFRRGLAGIGFELPPVLAGLFAGFIADVAILIHMAVVAERATDSRDAAYANRFTVVQSVIRKIIFVAVLLFLGSRPQIDAVAMIIGALGLKAGAFLQPAVHRVCTGGKPPEAVPRRRTFQPHGDGNEGDGILEERRMEYGNDESSDGDE